MEPRHCARFKASSLESFYGIDSTLLPNNPEAIIQFPYGFRVVEVRPRGKGSGYYLYFVKRVNMSSMKAAWMLKLATGCRKPSLAGLKDTCAVAYQYISLKCSHTPPLTISIGNLGFKAWLVGMGGRFNPGSHEGNIFRVRISTRLPKTFCSRLEKLSWIPGFFGPQRFGVDRPNSHLYALHTLKGDLERLIAESLYRYPGEWRSCPGDYERRLLKSPWRPQLPRVVFEALQSFLFNEALSEALRRGLNPEMIGEKRIWVSCPGGFRVRVPAARLPHERLSTRKTLWARIVSEVSKEAGIDLKLLGYKAGLRPALRPLVYPVCRVKCRPGEGEVLAILALPPGAYATIAFRTAALIDWDESYSACVRI
ncbi:MAG: tRNA pseudouridine(13) synthase TruD [Desulfurococcales archaeon]|nr:tRNA pseudouridine(13) synthase TruD [Desulfurococcales archaeon]